MAIYLEDQLPGVKLNGLNTKKAVDFSGAPSVALPSGVTFAGAQVVSVLKPAANSATAIQLTKADGTTAVLDVDTTNARVGINTAAPSQALHIAGGGLIITGNTSSQNGTFVMLDQFSGSARMYIQGADASTNGDFSLIIQRSDQSNSLSAFKVSAAGVSILTAATAPAASGSAAAAVFFSSTAGLGIYFGTGAPTVSAAKGSMYINTTATTTTTRLYINTDGSTTWTAFTTAA